MIDRSQSEIRHAEFEPAGTGSARVPRWWRGRAPAADHIRRLYVDGARTEDSIAAELHHIEHMYDTVTSRNRGQHPAVLASLCITGTPTVLLPATGGCC